MTASLETVPGLECLSGLETITIKQQYSKYNCCNYAVVSDKEPLFNLLEQIQEGGMCPAGHHRGFHIDGFDNEGKQLFALRRPGVSFSDKVELFMNDALVSVVRSKLLQLNMFRPVFSINDAENCPILTLRSEISNDTTNFKLRTTAKTVVGEIQNINRTFERFSEKDDYVITFPADLAVQYKLAVAAAAVLIDFKYHEPWIKRGRVPLK